MEKKNTGLATAGLVLGIVGICLSFIPILNNIAFFLGVLAVIFGIISLAKKTSKGKAVAALILGILSVVITLSLQSSWSKSLDETSKELDKATGSSTEEVLKKDVKVTLGNFEATTDEYGLTESQLVVTVKNITKKKQSYDFHVEAVDGTGKRIADDYVMVNDLGPGQTTTEKIFQTVEDEKLDSMKSATFKITKASATAD